MPSTDTVEAFVAPVEGGDYVGALERFYAEGASMQENNDALRVGCRVLVLGEQQIMAAFKSITARKVRPAVVDGDQVAIRWLFWAGEQIADRRTTNSNRVTNTLAQIPAGAFDRSIRDAQRPVTSRRRRGRRYDE